MKFNTFFNKLHENYAKFRNLLILVFRTPFLLFRKKV